MRRHHPRVLADDDPAAIVIRATIDWLRGVGNVPNEDWHFASRKTDGSLGPREKPPPSPPLPPPPQRRKWHGYQPEFPALSPEEYRARRMQIMVLYRAGQGFSEIGRAIGRSRERVRQIIHQEERRLKFWSLRMGKPPRTYCDLPGDDVYRDVWLTYYPGPDPRLDYMEPVRPDDSQGSR